MYPMTWDCITVNMLDLPPTQDAIVAKKGLGWDSLQQSLKMQCHPGGDQPASWVGGRSKVHVFEP